jgi:hypothetical protein
MNKQEQILAFVDKLPFPMMLTEILLLKSSFCIDLISNIMEKSDKMASEAVLAFLAVIRFQMKKKDGDFSLEYIKNNWVQISRMAIERKVQSNLPSRALPLLEVLAKQLDSGPISVIELGASLGLIGRGLLEPKKIIAGKERYFSPHQQIPNSYRSIRNYLGIELAPPEKDWLLACEWHPIMRERLNRFISDTPPDERSFLYTGNAFEFPGQHFVREYVEKSKMQNSELPSNFVILTSFMLYQYNEKKQCLLESKISDFIQRYGGHWLKQLVNIKDSTFFIEWDNERIIQMNDDSCTNWRWI